MKLLVDMNLSPDWVVAFREAGWEAEHWSKVGNPRAADRELMAWSKAHGCVVFTHDLDFGSLLALTQAEGPSVIQVRTQDLTPAAIGKLVISALNQFQTELEAGALIILDECAHPRPNSAVEELIRRRRVRADIGCAPFALAQRFPPRRSNWIRSARS